MNAHRVSLPTVAAAALAVLLLSSRVPASGPQADDPASPGRTYQQIKAFALTGGSATLSGFVLKRDRADMTLSGAMYFAAPVDGHVTGAVFIGDGTFRAAVPASDFERDNVRRLLGADSVESDFKTAVLRFTDDTFAEIMRANRGDAPAPPQAARLAADLEPRLLQETGVNLSSRLALSIVNGESPGVFFGQFDGGRRGRFSLLLDPQTRIPSAYFNINGGERGLIFSYEPAIHFNDVWMAFYAQEDYDRRSAVLSDANDLVDVTHYQLDVDLRDAGSRLGVVAHIDAVARAANVRAVPFVIGESLSEFEQARLKKQLRVKGVRVAGAAAVAAQEDWEGGFTVFLSKPLQAGEKVTLEVGVEGNFMQSVPIIPECFYPASNTAWYPRHGYLDRATYDLTFTHQKRHKVASVGVRVSEAPAPDNRDLMVTTYRMEQPISLAVFALGPFDRKQQVVTWEQGGDSIPLEFNNVAKQIFPVKDTFILDELNNAVRYFSVFFGKYPYPTFGAAFHPYGFGQGFPTLLMIPPADRGSLFDPNDMPTAQETHVFLAHETAHQWWGNIVAWRSYRDQWLSEGFAEYSAMLYAAQRDKDDPASEMIRKRRQRLLMPPRTTLGVAKGRLNDIGPIILGQRLNTSKSAGAYQALIYQKGALVLRMLQFLLSNPSTGDDKAFAAMMSDFVQRYRNAAASTEQFAAVAGEHFARSPIGQKYGLRDLNWFFDQWVYHSPLPSYTLEYQLADQPDGSTMISGTVHQENVPDTWFMPLPVVFTFASNQEGRTTVRALGPHTPFELKLPARPKKIDLDPTMWVLSEKTTARQR